MLRKEGNILEGLTELKELYLAIGVGGVSFLVLISVLTYLLKGVLPILHQIQQDGAVTQNILNNNTKAIEEMSRSNQNVATALTLLDKSMSSVHLDVKKVVESTDDLEKRLWVIDEKLNR